MDYSSLEIHIGVLETHSVYFLMLRRIKLKFKKLVITLLTWSRRLVMDLVSLNRVFPKTLFVIRVYTDIGRELYDLVGRL